MSFRQRSYPPHQLIEQLPNDNMNGFIKELVLDKTKSMVGNQVNDIMDNHFPNCEMLYKVFMVGLLGYAGYRIFNDLLTPQKSQ